MDLNVKPEDLPTLYPLAGRKVRFETLQLHGGTPFKDPTTNAKGIPIYQAAAFTFDSTAQLSERFSIATEGKSNLYTRIGNPTVEAFEKRVAVLEGGATAVAVASGQAAQFVALTTLARAGDNIVASSLLYGGTIHQFRVLLERYGVSVKFAEGNDPVSMESLIDDKTKVIYCETISNPRFNVPNIPVIAEVAHRYGIPLVVDNTFGACGFIARPLDLGADILVESATKWIGGHGTTIGGVIVDGGRFDWSKSTRFPAFNTVAESNGSRFGIDALVGHTVYEVLKEKTLTTIIRLEILRDLGACLAPQSAWLLIQGLETLSLRVERHLSNALALARYLESHPKVAWVSYPGLPSHEDHEIAKRLLKGFGCVLSFGVKGGRGDIVVDNLKLHSHLANLGDVHSLIIHPASVTHGQLTEEERLAAGVPQDMLRVSVGTEHIDDIIEDYEVAFSYLDV
ncbi:O-acetylhomoserine (thiol)-lyase [Termitomyces sp. T112]|nr:O-acetylhomoserine (thiol)-lyase [Termitomyces sp. T112]